MAAPNASMVGNRVKGTDFWSRLAPREQWLLFGLTIAALVMLAAILFVQRTRRLNQIREELDQLQTGIGLLRAEGANYQIRKREADQELARLATKPISFGTLLDSAKRTTGVSATREQETNQRTVSEGLVSRGYTFDLRRVGYDKLVEYIRVLEGTREGVVKANSLTLRSLNPEEDAINAKVEMKTWEREPEPESEEGSKEE